jgi:hypothetical protein
VGIRGKSVLRLKCPHATKVGSIVLIPKSLLSPNYNPLLKKDSGGRMANKKSCAPDKDSSVGKTADGHGQESSMSESASNQRRTELKPRSPPK